MTGLRHGAQGAALLLALALAIRAAAVDQSAPPATVEHDQVLVITGTDPYLPAFVTADRAMRATVALHHPRPVAWLYESIDMARLGEEPGADFADLLAKKYAQTDVDAVMLVTEPAARFYLRFRDRLWPNAPLSVHSVSPTFAQALPQLPGLSAQPTLLAIEDTLKIARRLQPRAKRVLIVSGVSPFDQLQMSEVRDALNAASLELPVEFLVGQSPRAIAERLAGETIETIVVYMSLFRDRGGHVHVPRDVLVAISAASATPIYGVYDSYMGHGLAAGAMESFSERGESAGRMVMAALTDPKAPPKIAPMLRSRCVADGRLLERYGMSRAALPDGCDVRYVEPSFLSRYGWAVVLVALALAAQTTLIAGLLIQRRRRLAAEHTLQAQRTQLLHAARLAVAGELTASIAHEINQPLGAILSNADAAEMLLKSGQVDHEELLQILGDIRRDDLRASEVIKRLRALLARHETERRRCSLNEVAQHSSAILVAEARRRGDAVEYDLAARDAIVLGDPVQLQQVVIALGLNAFDASATLPDGERRIRIATMDGPDGVQLTVRDYGVGIAPEDLPRVFESFFTTKRRGMGLGLSIARSIVDAHGGTIEAINRQQGAEFRITLPRAPATDQSNGEPLRRTA